MFLAATLFLALAEPQPATAEQEAHIKSTLAPAVQVMGQKDSCSHPEIKPSDFLAIIGAYEGETIPTVTVAGQDDDTSLADVVITEFLAANATGWSGKPPRE